MIEASMAFFAAFLLSWPALIGLVLLGILFEHNGSRGWAVSTALAIAAVSYFFFAVPLTTLLIGAGAYLAFGLVWSFYRYKRHAMLVVAQNKTADALTRENALYRLHPKNMLSTITAWIVIWPFSAIENVAGDIINSIQLLVTKFFRGVYFRIYDSAVNELK